jgi:hypothetical protein
MCTEDKKISGGVLPRALFSFDSSFLPAFPPLFEGERKGCW